ncbi:MAG: FAD-binding protein [Clostridia bacterium]|nr:FAD-binding protein [Clostridia bacterium]
MEKEYDVLIVGSGVAGLYAALNFEPQVRVLMITKREQTVCNSMLAQGGVAAVVDTEHDDYRLHIADTLIAGGYQNDLHALQILVTEGPKDVLRIMEHMDVDFDRVGEQVQMTLEGGHSRRRILHHKDSTGREMTEKLYAAVKKLPNVTLIEHTQLSRLTPVPGGFWATLLQDGDIRQVACSYCLLCTGGIGRVYPYTTNSAIATGDGIALAYELGARIKNLHYVQFHPTAFAADEGRERFLISEAVRGEGAKLLNAAGEAFMTRYDERGELAPRDVVSRCIIEEAQRQGSEKFYLDIRYKGEAFIKDRFPMIYARCLEEGVDMTKDLIPVFPCQHYLMGGIDVGLFSNTTVDRLYAAGECAHTGVHGLNRLASNSLLEALVFSRRATYDIARRMRHEPSGVTAPPPAVDASGKPLPPGIRTRIRGIMQKAWFVKPDYAAAREGLQIADDILRDLHTGGYALSADYVEANSLATVCKIIMEELLEEEKQGDPRMADNR